MTVYIFPEMREKFLKLIARASKHLAVAPKVTVSGPVTKTKVTRHVWRDDDGVGERKIKEVVTVLEITIDEITSGDWVLVSDVLFNEGFLTMENGRYYANIPESLGLNYKKCDYCGHTHANRAKAHIVYNTVTGEWKQIGTSCGKKMFKGGDICRFTVELYKCVDISGGCMDFGFADWCAGVPDHSWKIAYNVDDVIARVVMYRKEVCAEWEKAERINRFERVGGTTEKLLSFRDVSRDEIPQSYIDAVKGFVARLESKPVLNGWGDVEDDFNGKIKAAFEPGYVLKSDFYAVFFAVKMYDDSLTIEDWKTRVSATYKVGEKYAFVGCELVNKEYYEDVYGAGYFCKFTTTDGITITKTFSNWDGFDSQFRNENGTYSFMARVDYINNNKRTVKLGGRVSRIK